MFKFLAERQYSERELFLILFAPPLSPFKDLQCPLKDYKWNSTIGSSAKKDIQTSSSCDKLALKSFYTPQFHMPFQSLRPNWPFHVSLVLGNPPPPGEAPRCSNLQFSANYKKKTTQKTVVMTLL